MKYAKKALFTCTLCFTLLSYLLSLFIRLTDGGNLFMGFPELSRVLIFSAILGLCGLLFDIKQLPRSAARLIHFVLTCANFCIVLATRPYGGDFRMIFASLLVFMLVYWIIIALLTPIKKLTK